MFQAFVWGYTLQNISSMHDLEILLILHWQKNSVISRLPHCYQRFYYQIVATFKCVLPLLAIVFVISSQCFFKFNISQTYPLLIPKCYLFISLVFTWHAQLLPLYKLLLLPCYYSWNAVRWYPQSSLICSCFHIHHIFILLYDSKYTINTLYIVKMDVIIKYLVHCKVQRQPLFKSQV